ncbi:hypothetical protein VTO73DRAFT_13932 [Trametes versicolor]
MPFPAPDEREDVVQEVFEDACRIYGQDTSFYTLTDDDIKLLRIEDTNVRSRVKQAAVAAVPKAYGLHVTPNAISKHFAASQYEIYDQYLTAIEQYNVSVMQRFWQLHCQDIFKKGLEISGCSAQNDAVEHVIQHAADDELNRELARMQERFGDALMDVSDDASPSDQPTITPPHHPFNGRRDHLPRISNDNSTFNHNDVSLDVFDRDCNDSLSVDGHRDPAQGDDDDDDAEDIEGFPSRPVIMLPT